MKKQRIFVLSLILMLTFSIMPIAKANNEEFKTITLEEIANQIEDDYVKELVETLEGDGSIVSKNVTENTLTITATSQYGTGKYETTFTLKDNILTSSKIQTIEDWKMDRTNKFHWYMTENVFTKISELMGYNEKVMYYLWDTAIMDNYTLEKDGVQVIRDQNLRILDENDIEMGISPYCYDYIFKIDLSKKAILLDITPLYEVEDIFDKNYSSTIAEMLQKQEFIGAYGGDRMSCINIINYDHGHENDDIITTLTINDSIITSETITGKYSDTQMTKENEIKLMSTLYFLDSIGQTAYGYQQGELLNTLTKDEVKDYTLQKEGFEIVNVENGKYQYKIDFTKKVPLIKEQQKPQEPQNNVVVNNVIGDNKINQNQSVDNTIASGNLPQTGYSLMNILITISIISMISAIIAYKIKKQKDLS